MFTRGSINIVVSKIAPMFLACGEGLIISVPKRRGGSDCLDYTLRISREAHPLIIVGQAFLNLSDTVAKFHVVVCRERNIQLSVIGAKVKLHFVES